AVHYDLCEREDLAKFLVDADIRLVRAPFLKKLNDLRARLPRRQEAEAAYVGSQTALVTHEEVEAWATHEAQEEPRIVALSHCWEAREHPDPYGYQLSKLAPALHLGDWVFVDYTSLYQFERLSIKEELSFRRAMRNMHVLYAHECSRTLRIGTLTPEELRREGSSQPILIYHKPDEGPGQLREVPASSLTENRTEYPERGWCQAEMQWSSSRRASDLSWEVDSTEADAAGLAPMAPDIFRARMKHTLKFTHRSDEEAVFQLQAQVFREKCQGHQALQLVRLNAFELDVALQALEHYPKLRKPGRSLEILNSPLPAQLALVLEAGMGLANAVQNKPTLRVLTLCGTGLGDEEAVQMAEALAASSLESLRLPQNRIGPRGAAALEALVQKLNQLDLTGNSICHMALKFAKRIVARKVSCDVTHEAVELLVRNFLHAWVNVEGMDEDLEDLTVLSLRLDSTGDLASAVPFFNELQSLTLQMPSRCDDCAATAEELAKLQQLHSLSLQLGPCDIGSEGSRRLTEGLEKLQHLGSLSLKLESNKIGPEGSRSLGEVLTKLPQLSKLKLELRSNNVGYDGAASLGHSLGHLKKLVSLSIDLSDNDVGDAGVQCLGEKLGKLPYLSSFYLKVQSNNIGPEGGRSMGQGFEKLWLLNSLCVDLGFNDVGPEGGRSLGDSLGRLQQLSSLSLKLASNNIGPEGARSLGTSLGKLQKLSTLELGLRSNNVGPDGGRSLGEALGKLKQLSSLTLDFSKNFVGDAGGESLGAGLENLPRLESLDMDLSYSCLSAAGGLRLAWGLGTLKRISSLCLNWNNNKLGKAGGRSLGEALGKLQHLSSLTLKVSCNGIQHEGGQSLGEGLGKIWQLTALSLDLEWNELGAKGCHSLAAGLSKLQQLSCLELNLSNNSSDSPGHCLGQLQQLNSLILDFSNNFMVDDLALLGKLRNIHHVSLNFSNTSLHRSLRSLGEGLAQLQRLSSLNLKLYEEGVRPEDGERSLGEGLVKLLQLNSLSVDLSLLKPYGKGSICSLLEGLHQLARLSDLTLDLRGSGIGDHGGRSLGGGLRELRQLNSLSLKLSSSSIRPEGGRSLGEGLGKLQQVSSLTLDLADNSIGPEGGRSLGEGLGKLRQLKSLSLDLRDNKIGDERVGSLGKELGKLQHLGRLSLDISGNLVGDGGCQSLGQGLGDLRHLVSLSLVLKANDIGACNGLGEGLGRLQQLRSFSLDLGANKFGPNGIRSLHEGMGQLHQLSSLSLNVTTSHFLDKETGLNLGEALGKLQQLNSLNLDLTTAYLHAARSMHEGVRHLEQLGSLKLKVDSFVNSEDTCKFGECFEQLQRLTDFSLEFKGFAQSVESAQLQNLGLSLRKLTCLRSFSLTFPKNSNFTKGGQGLGEGLGYLQQLCSLSLDLSSTELEDKEGIRSLGEGLQKLQQLSSLSVALRSTKLGDKGSRNFFEGLGKLQQLSSLSLDLGSNDISDEGVRPVRDGLGKLPLISLNLDVSANRIKLEGCQGLAEGLSQIQELRWLGLKMTSNKIGDEGGRNLGEGLAKLQHLSSATICLKYTNMSSEGMDQLSQRDQMQVMAALNEMQMQEMMNTYNNLVERCFNECITSFRTKAVDFAAHLKKANTYSMEKSLVPYFLFGLPFPAAALAATLCRSNMQKAFLPLPQGLEGSEEQCVSRCATSSEWFIVQLYGVGVSKFFLGPTYFRERFDMAHSGAEVHVLHPVRAKGRVGLRFQEKQQQMQLQKHGWHIKLHAASSFRVPETWHETKEASMSYPALQLALAALAAVTWVAATDLECGEGDCSAVEASNQGCLNGQFRIQVVEGDEVPLLDVQLLQKSMYLTPSKPSALETAPVQADGSLMQEGQVEIHPVEEHSLLQTSMEVDGLEASNETAVLGMDGWRLRPNASCFVEGLLPVSGTKPLLVQLGTVHELSNSLSYSSISISSFLFADAAKLRSSLILSIYFALYVFSIVSMYYHMTTVRPSSGKTPMPGYGKPELAPEDEILRSNSYLSWLCVTWLSPMVAKLGHSWNSAMSKCSPDELPPVNSPEFQAIRQCERFEELWAEEVRVRGLEEASVMRVICKLWGYTRLFWFHSSLFVHVVIGNLYQVFLIQTSLSYFFWLQKEVHANNGQLPDMTKPILVSIVAFSAQPLVFAILCSLEANLSMKFDQCIAGVAVAMFKKTQRLPASMLSQDKPVGSAEEADHLPDKVSKKPNAMMTINQDVIGNFHGLTFQASLTINASLTVAVLLVLMAVKLRLATLFCLAVAIPALTVSVILSGAMGINMMQLQDVMDKRVYLLREVLKGIRIVKCYAWENAMEEQIKRIRGRELSMLGIYFRMCSHFVVLFNLFPRLLTCAGLWGFLHLYGNHDLASIFACLQILASLRQESSTLSGGIQRMITVRISSMRVENYLKQEEAPVLPGVSVPKWVEIWPKQVSPQGPQPSFSIRGSYLYSRDKPTEIALHNLNLEVQKGEMVALVGGVGSGKSTLLEAALGELHPLSEEKAFLSRPHVCGYSAQVPHIAEGTLRENVVFGQPWDEARYRQAVSAAGLDGDLKLLPGGDEAFIGARGISLSGGQRARISLARTAYNANAELVLLDDPFGSVDAPTALWILEELLCGPLLKDRARIVALQPEIERLRKFDRVFVLAKGRIVASGKPSEVAETEEFKQLLRSSALEDTMEVTPVGTKTVKEQRPATAGVPSPVPATTLRESEGEGRPTWEMTSQYIGIGRWRNMLNSMIIFALVLFIFLLCDISLANCTNALALDSTVATGRYFGGYLFWMTMGVTGLYVGWIYGAGFSLRISNHIHCRVVNQLLHAPIDRFFDKHPVGRIMNRLTMDMATIDLYLYMKVSGSVMILFQTLVPLAYIHFIMPYYMSAIALPFYYVVFQLYLRYQNTAVPLRYCFKTSSSITQSHLSDVMTNTVVVRGFGEQNRVACTYAACVDNSVKADLTDDRLMKRWLCNRVNYLWTFYNSITYIIGLYNASWLGPGTLGIALTNLLLLETMIEPSLEMMAGALFELIALARVHEYTSVTQEKAMSTPEDAKLRNYSVRFFRNNATPMTVREANGRVEVLAKGSVLLHSTPDGRSLMLADNGSDCHIGRFQELCTSCAELNRIPSLHHIVAVNDAVGCAKEIAQELCKNPRSFMTATGFTTQPQVVVEFQSSWLSDGARLDIQELRAGYAEVPQDVLKGVTFSVEPRMKVAVVGTTGCGKSSMLLALLRIIEPRGGKIVINGIDTQEIGLATLRSSLGLVPQDPMLFTGTLRHNLDPFKVYTDGRIRKAVQYAHLEAFVNTLPLGLDHVVSDEGGNLSFGQRQLLCLARMVLRQPALLLLDEATSAIDPATQESVQDTINHAFPSSTMLAVAHRLETIMECEPHGLVGLGFHQGLRAAHGFVPLQLEVLSYIGSVFLCE
ncbi:ABCC1, partial [Symbiodinium pilosum]